MRIKLAWQAICDSTGCEFRGAQHMGRDAIELANEEAEAHREHSLVVTESGSRSHHMVTARSVEVSNVESIGLTRPMEGRY